MKRSIKSANATKLITNAIIISTNLPAAKTESPKKERKVDVRLDDL